MKRSMIFNLAITCLLVAIFSCQNAVQAPASDAIFTTDDNEDVIAIKNLFTAAAEAYSNGDPTKFTDLLADDVVVLDAKFFGMDKAALVQEIDKNMEENDVEWTITSFDDVKISGRLAMVLFTEAYQYTSKETGEVTKYDKVSEFFNLRKRSDGKWEIIYFAMVFFENQVAQEER